MKYIVLIYQPSAFDPKTIDPEKHAQIGAEYQRLSKLPNVEPGISLGKFQDAKFVKIDSGEPRLEALPLDERGDVVSAIWTVEVENEDELLTLAAQIPAAKLGGTVEIRPAGIYW